MSFHTPEYLIPTEHVSFYQDHTVWFIPSSKVSITNCSLDNQFAQQRNKTIASTLKSDFLYCTCCIVTKFLKNFPTQFLDHPGPALRQGQWNVVKLGNIDHQGQCKRQRFKTIRIEANDPTTPTTISIMTDGIINVSLQAFLPRTSRRIF